MSAPSEIKNVILIGATGNVGRLLIEPLAAHFNLTLLTRPSSAASLPSNLPTNVRTVSADYTIADLTIAFTGQDAVVSAVGAAAFASQKLLIDAAVAAGVRRFLPSEFSVNSDAKAVRELVPVFQAKDAVLQHLKAKENEGLTWTGLAVGPLLDWGLQAGFLDIALPTHTVTFWSDGETRFSATTVADLGTAVVNVLRRPAETRNKYLFVRSVTTTQVELLAALNKQTPGANWTVKRVDTAAEIADAQKGLAEGNYASAVRLVQASVLSGMGGMKADFDRDEKERLANTLLGVEGGKVEEIVREVLASTASQ